MPLSKTMGHYIDTHGITQKQVRAVQNLLYAMITVTKHPNSKKWPKKSLSQIKIIMFDIKKN